MVRKGLTRRCPAWAGMAAALALSSTSAHADSKPGIVIVPLSQGDNVPAGAGARFAQQIAEELQGRDEVRVLPPPAAPRPGPASPAPAAKAGSADKGAKLLAEGGKLLSELRFEQACTALRAGLEAALAEPARADFAQVLEGYVHLAAASFRLGDEKAAQGALYELARLEPTYRLPDRYPPVFVREFDKAKRRAEKAPRGKLVLDGPPGATGFIDGRDLGMVAVDEELAAGRHYVKVEGTRGELFGQQVEVKPGTVTVKATFAAAPAPVPAASAAAPEEPKLYAALDAEAAGKVIAYGRATGAEFLLVGMLYRSGEHQLTAATALYSALKQGFVAIAPATVDRELLTSKVEAFRVADEVLARIASFGPPAALPLNLTGKQVKVAAQTVAAKPATEEVQVAAPRIVLRPAEPPKPPAAEVRVLKGHTEALAAAPPPSREPRVQSQGVRWYWWVVGGVAVAAAAGGAVYGVTQATRPVTGTVSASW